MISIIVPVYNAEKYLNRAIDSVRRQTFSDWELILIDDESPDRCGAICDEYAGADKRIRVIHQKNGASVQPGMQDWTLLPGNISIFWILMITFLRKLWKPCIGI